jgi:hypothetical protein
MKPLVNADAISNPEDNTNFGNGATIPADGTVAMDTGSVSVRLIYQDANGAAASTTPKNATITGSGGANATWSVTLDPAPINARRYLLCARFQKMAGVAVRDRFITVGSPTV